MHPEQRRRDAGSCVVTEEFAVPVYGNTADGENAHRYQRDRKT